MTESNRLAVSCISAFLKRLGVKKLGARELLGVGLWRSDMHRSSYLLQSCDKIATHDGRALISQGLALVLAGYRCCCQTLSGDAPPYQVLTSKSDGVLPREIPNPAQPYSPKPRVIRARQVAVVNKTDLFCLTVFADF
jgi:hypothetical protein